MSTLIYCLEKILNQELTGGIYLSDGTSLNLIPLDMVKATSQIHEQGISEGCGYYYQQP
jgi:hypothetical protein